MTLLWTALFVLSLALQYMTFAAPASTLAVHDEGLFELDGNATNSGAPGDDWDLVHDGTSSADDTFFVNDPVDDQNDDSFTGGSTKDDLPIGGWLWKKAKASQAKNDIVNAFAAAYSQGGNTYAYFGLTKWEASGDNYVGFWFLKNAIGKTGAGNPPGSPFSGGHSVGDVLVLADYTNGGSIAAFDVYEWVGSGGSINGTLNLIDTGVECDLPGADEACGTTNTAQVPAPWPFQGRNEGAGYFPPGTFFEGGINLTALGLDTACFTGIVAETRSSQSVDATLSDFALGNFNTCEPPTIETQVSDSGSGLPLAGAINVGESVFDIATLTGDGGPVSGEVDFFLCGPEPTAPDCSTGGVPAAGSVISEDIGISAPFTATKDDIGWFCYRAEYTPAPGSKYLAASHTNKTTECFQVIPANVTITKTAVQSPVNAGDQIGFILSWGNSGPGTATGVVVTDTLPGPAGVDWSIYNTAGSGSTCSLSGPVGAEVLTCNVGTIPGNTAVHGTVTLVSPTTPATCGTTSNTGEITSANDGSAQASASIVVNCPDIKVTKTPDGGSVQAGDPAVFTIVVENLGPGTATEVTLTDDLPAGYVWALGGADQAACSIDTVPSPDVLSCDFGTMASGATKTITLTAPTTGANCAVIPNTAVGDATNEPNTTQYTANNSDSADIDVLCGDVVILKEANPVGPVNAGDDIGFDVTVTNQGDGEARGVTVDDPLPAGIAWEIVPASAGWSINASNHLVYGPAILPAQASTTVHIVGTTDAADCGIVSNKATVTTTNDGGGDSTATVTVNCPDITVTKVADEGPFSATDQIGFTVEITNEGPGDAYGAWASDPLPGTGWSFDPEVAGWTFDGNTLKFAGDLAAGASSSVHVVRDSTTADCPNVENTVTVGADNEPEGKVDEGNSATADLDVLCPDITVTKVADEGPFSATDQIGFTVEITNEGPGDAYGAWASDPLPGTGWSFDPEVAGWTFDGNTLKFAGDLAAGASSSVHVVRDSTTADCPNVENTVTVGADNEPEGKVDEGNSATADLDVLCPDITVDKTPTVTPISAGETAMFTIEVWNAGPGMAYDVTLDDALPQGVDWVVDGTSPDTITCDPIVGGALHCDLGDLAPGRGENSVFIYLAGQTSFAQCADGDFELFNEVDVSAGNEPENAPLPNHDDATILVNCPEIGISKTADHQGAVSAGDSVGFTVDIGNTGTGAASGVSVDDPLPADLLWSLAGTTPADDARWTLTGSAGAQVLSFAGDLAGGEFSSAHITAVSNAEVCGSIPNTATISLGQEELGSGYDAELVDCPDVVVEKTPDGASINSGDTATFSLVVTNLGPGRADDVTLTDDLPAGTWTLGGPDAESCSIVDGTLSCDFGSLEAEATATVTLSRVTTAADCGLIPNEAFVSAGNEAAADKPDSDTGDITVLCAYGLTLDKSNDAPIETIDLGDGLTADLPTAKEGATVTFTLDYTLTDDPVTNGVLTDVLPAGVTYVDGSATDSAEFTFTSYDPATRTLRWDAATVTANGTVSYKATIDTGAADLAQPLVNVATIDSTETDPDSDNSEVYVPAVEAVTSSPSITPPPTDTLSAPQAPSNPGFALMLVLLGLAGFALALGIVTPVPERVRRRDRRS